MEPMEPLDAIRSLFSNARLGANLIAIHFLITITILLSLVLRRLIARGGDRLARMSGLRWLETASEEAIKHARNFLFWMTAASVVLLLIGGAAYQLGGRDIRIDLRTWYDNLTIAHLVTFAVSVGELVLIVVATWLAGRIVRRVWPVLQELVQERVGDKTDENTVPRWFRLFQWYQLATLRLAACWAIARIFCIERPADFVLGFLLRVCTILVVGRLLTLACRILMQGVARLGEVYLTKGRLKPYWERVTRLFPFGIRCFDAAVWITVASMCVHELHFIDMIANFGPRIVRCIGIVFITRVLIELLQVLLGEALGVYDEEKPIDQKALTLMPLLYSLSQYVLYFGSALVMMNEVEIDTRPILAGAGILGLAVGLGAQNLVTDLVSGFFILFENQYLVGDYVQIGDAAGVVEAVGIRLTQIRDGQGKLFIIPNGQVKGVVSFSKGYVNAVVDLDVPSGTDLESIFRSMAEAGRRLRKQHPSNVLGETQIQGLIKLGFNDLTVRAVTKVQPGTHGRMEREYRLLLKQLLDQEKPTKMSVAA